MRIEPTEASFLARELNPLLIEPTGKERRAYGMSRLASISLGAQDSKAGMFTITLEEPP